MHIYWHIHTLLRSPKDISVSTKHNSFVLPLCLFSSVVFYLSSFMIEKISNRWFFFRFLFRFVIVLSFLYRHLHSFRFVSFTPKCVRELFRFVFRIIIITIMPNINGSKKICWYNENGKTFFLYACAYVCVWSYCLFQFFQMVYDTEIDERNLLKHFFSFIRLDYTLYTSA